MSDTKHPIHYNKGIECWKYIISQDMGFMDGNIVKYITRFRHKGGYKDLLKADEYLQKLIEIEKEKFEDVGKSARGLKE